MRALFLSAALASAALSGCVRCCVPLNAPPYDPAQWGWGPQDRFYVTRSYYGFAKDYPGVHPYRMVPPGVAQCPPADFPGCGACGPTVTGAWPAQMPMAGPNIVGPNIAGPYVAGPNLGPPNAAAFPNAGVAPGVAAGPTAIAF
jgi:hypothetical protein